MKSQTNCLVSVLLLAGSLSGIMAQAQAPCFMTGTLPLPAIVTFNPASVLCDNTRPAPFLKVPDIFIKSGDGTTIRYSDIDFPRSAGSPPPTIFALRTFGKETNVKLLEIYAQLYGCMNAAVRSQGDKKSIKSLKGPIAFLQLHLRRQSQDTTPSKLSELYSNVSEDFLSLPVS
ncbi:hypothetical protein, variant 1 [Puccinia striiformis f. sp. tritici PST-78]|uniref:DUF7143 domain-containing protein n=1 Tax=Puccinia striiformis f. sp. tritici PST-78 TaxID=1165861 RepID=A0A0L0VC28_9BASI|nr:hypothetical protein, variant 1 [Puccinia striiformis f. sp. tritici PST-78]